MAYLLLAVIIIVILLIFAVPAIMVVIGVDYLFKSPFGLRKAMKGIVLIGLGSAILLPIITTLGEFIYGENAFPAQTATGSIETPALVLITVVALATMLGSVKLIEVVAPRRNMILIIGVLLLFTAGTLVGVPSVALSINILGRFLIGLLG